MIPYDELDRALARWKARAQGTQGPQGHGSVVVGTVEAVEAEAPEMLGEATPMPIPADELGSIPNVANVPERTGEIDVGELEAYEEGEEEV
jgi:hypothetical protein